MAQTLAATGFIEFNLARAPNIVACIALHPANTNLQLLHILSTRRCREMISGSFFCRD